MLASLAWFPAHGQAVGAAGLRRANTGEVAYHMPYGASLSSAQPARVPSDVAPQAAAFHPGHVRGRILSGCARDWTRGLPLRISQVVRLLRPSFNNTASSSCHYKHAWVAAGVAGGAGARGRIG